jgi:putative oxidoreductase
LAKGSSSSFESYTLALLRIVTGFVFTLHGFQKLFGAFGGLGGHGRPAAALSLLWVAGLIESICGPLIILGLFTRPLAFLLCGEMAVAYFLRHAPQGFWPLTNGGEVTVLYCFIFLYLVNAGPGPFSLDQSVRKKG